MLCPQEVRNPLIGGNIGLPFCRKMRTNFGSSPHGPRELSANGSSSASLCLRSRTNDIMASKQLLFLKSHIGVPCVLKLLL
eukprot:2410477-Pyramimonas_sp.AAC.1